MTGRTMSFPSYRFGFNGKEKDDAISSVTNYDYGFRIYNPAIGRFLSVDPLKSDYPWFTPYQFAGNMPIIAIDLDGLEPEIMIGLALSKEKHSLENLSLEKSLPNPEFAIEKTFELSGGMESFEQNKDLLLQNGYFRYSGNESLTTDTDPTQAEKYNLFVNGGMSLVLNDFEISEKQFANILLGNMITGEGPENLVFPENGFISQKLMDTKILKTAIYNWYISNIPEINSGSLLP